jgi:glucokinase
MSSAIGIDLGGTKLLGILVDERGSPLARRERPTCACDGPDVLVGSIAALARELAEEARAAGRPPRGVGVGAPGPLDPRTGVVYAMPNLGEDYVRFPLRERLTRALPELPVAVENDANAAIQGEVWTGAAKGCEDAILLTLGTGVGGGIVAAGRMIRGARGAGAELGHVIVEPDGPPCGCGGRGCLEQYASGTAIARLAAEALARRREGALAQLAAPSAQDVVRAARAGDELALAVIDRGARALGTALASIVHVLNPELVLIGGGFGSAAWDLLEPSTAAEMKSRTFVASWEGLKLARAALGSDAGAIGAARSVI